MYLSAIRDELQTVRAQHRYRSLDMPQERIVADFSTNDYLALATDSRMVESLKYAKRVGSGGARLLGGRHREHLLLEEDIAGWVDREAALLFSSGYLAALGAITVLAEHVEVIYSDALNHASIIDAVRLSKTRCDVYEHGRLPPRAERRSPALIVSETFFGMDGDCADVRAYLDGLNDGDILLLDDAHALGVYGAQGSGLAAAVLDDRVVVLGTLGKAVGAAGGFIAGPAAVIELLVNRARSFIFDTALPPAIAFAARVGITLARGADDRRERLRRNAVHLRERLPASSGDGAAPIVPVLIGGEQAALDAMRACLERGLVVPAVRPPTVPPGTSRLRVSLRSDHTAEQLDMLASALSQCTAIS